MLRTSPRSTTGGDDMGEEIVEKQQGVETGLEDIDVTQKLLTQQLGGFLRVFISCVSEVLVVSDPMGSLSSDGRHALGNQQACEKHSDLITALHEIHRVKWRNIQKRSGQKTWARPRTTAQ